MCRVVTNMTGSDIATRQQVLSRRKMEYNAMSPLQKDAWEEALGQRAYNIKKCCGLVGYIHTVPGVSSGSLYHKLLRAFILLFTLAKKYLY